MLNDPRDWPFIPLMFQCALFGAAGITFFFLPHDLRWWLAPLYALAFLFGVLDRYTLMLHNTSHRPLFKPEYRAFNLIVPVFLGPFLGQSPGTYLSHHLGMHHREENGPNDLSSTMRYQRDRLDHWLAYFGRFFFFGAIELPAYHQKAGRKRLARASLAGELFLYFMIAGLMFVDWAAATFIFLAPFLIIRVLMMCGNWGQHAFIDPDRPDDPFKNSITCIEVRYNRRCFNDGYHIEHHIQPRLHWSEHPEVFDAKRAEYGAADAIVFRGLDFFMIWVLLMTRRFDYLAKAFVPLPGAPVRSHAEIVELLKKRTRAINQPVRSPAHGGETQAAS